MPGCFELKSSSSRNPKFNLVAANHEIILTSERYEAKAAALAAFEKRSSSADQPCFVL